MSIENEKITLSIPPQVNIEDYEIGVLVCRMQVPNLHPVHRELINTVCRNHKKVILFLGCSVVEQTKKNPLDFGTRRAMIQSEWPDIVIIPMKDQRFNADWSNILDKKIVEPFGNRKALLYGGRDSFIPYYQGKYPTVELVSDGFEYSGTAVRDEVAREVVNSEDFRKGVVYANYGRYPIIMPCADIVVYDPTKRSILLARKPNEKQFRFIGGHIDITDETAEAAAVRELHEEAPGLSIAEAAKDLTYICNGKIDDWRHDGKETGIISTLFMATRMSGSPKPADDIEEVKWFEIDAICDYEKYARLIVPEHVTFFTRLVEHFEKTNILETAK